MRLLINGWYFLVFVMIISSQNLSLQYENSMNWIVRLLLGLDRGSNLYGNPLMHSMSSLNLAL